MQVRIESDGRKYNVRDNKKNEYDIVFLFVF